MAINGAGTVSKPNLTLTPAEAAFWTKAQSLVLLKLWLQLVMGTVLTSFSYLIKCAFVYIHGVNSLVLGIRGLKFRLYLVQGASRLVYPQSLNFKHILTTNFIEKTRESQVLR